MLPPAVSAKEIDLLGLLDVLLAAKKRIITIVFAFALVGLGNRLSDTAKMDQ